MSYLSDFKFKNDDTLNFNVNNLPVAFLNSLRRIMINDIETIAFRTEYGKESDIKIETNTSVINNEFLAHRLSLVPIHYDPKRIGTFDKNKYEFIIDITNTTTKPLDVTTEHIQIKEGSKVLSRTVAQSFFPPDKITGEYILLNRLKPNKSGDSDKEGGEKLKINMKADKSTGKEHARYNPTCVSVFTNVRDMGKIEEELKKRFHDKDIERKTLGKKPLTDEEKKPIIKSFMVSEADRYFKTDASGEPNSFEFYIESDGRIPPHVIFDKSLFVFEEKLDNFMKKINESEKCIVKTSDCIMKSYDFIVEDEDYTIGNVIQEFMFRLYQNVSQEDKKVKYVSANVPHPLENKLLIRVSLEELTLGSDYVKELITECVSEIKSIIDKLKTEMGGNKKFVLMR